MMRTVRVFISSPADAIHERNRIGRVVARLNSMYAGVAKLEAIRWETDFYQAHQTFQTQIAEARDCDIVIGILKYRLGSPLPSNFPAMPEPEPFRGEAYPSGTAYEILSSITARMLDEKEKPDIFVFRNADPPSAAVGSADIGTLESEWQRLEAFFRRFFFTPKGEFRFAFHSFRSTDMLEEQAEALLLSWLKINIRAGRKVAWPVEVRGSPFRALDVFDYEHRDVFFGRQRETSRAVQSLADAAAERAAGAVDRLPFLLVTGPSGAGKSSLLRAGLIPAITGSGAGETDEWRVATFRPTEQLRTPFAAMAAALLGTGQKPTAAVGDGEREDVDGLRRHARLRDAPLALPELTATGDADNHELAACLAQPAGAGIELVLAALEEASRSLSKRENFDRPARIRLLLVVDQLDEIFGAGISEGERDAFTDLLAALAATGQVWIAASLRAGLYEHLLNDRKLSALKRAGATSEIGAPGPVELAAIVRGPAEAAGLTFEKDAMGLGLDERILADFDRPDMLPLLEFTLEALFQKSRMSDSGRELTHSAYEEMNGVAGAVSFAAEDAVARLSDDARACIPRLLRLLVKIGGDATEIETAVILRDVPISQFGADMALTALADALTNARLLVSGSTDDGQPALRLSHQRILSLWKPFALALEENSFFYRVSEEIVSAQQRWTRNGRKWSQLIRDPIMLSESRRLADQYRDELAKPVRDFVLRSRLRARIGVIALSATALALAGLAITALLSYQRAERNFQVALDTLDGVVIDIADGLKNTAGMSVSARGRILERVQQSADELQATTGTSAKLLETRWMMLNSFGDAYWAGGDGARALTAYQSGLAIGRALFEQQADNLDWQRGVAVNFERVGDILNANGDLDAAIDSYEQSAAIRRLLSARDPANSQWRRDTSVSLDRLGDVRMAKGDTAGAMHAYEEGLEITRALIASDTSNTLWLRDFSVGLEKIGEVERVTGNIQAAIGRFEEGLKIRRVLVEADPDDTQWRRDLLVTLNKLGESRNAIGSLEEAALSFTEAIAIARQLIRLDPDATEWRRDLTVSLNRLSDARFQQGDREGALSGYKESLSIARDLSKGSPGNADWQRDISLNLNNIGKLQALGGDNTAAVEAFTESLAIARRLGKQEPTRTEWQRDTAVTLQRLADVNVTLGKTQEALALQLEALDIGRKLSALNPENWEWRRDVALGLHRVGDRRLAAGHSADALASFEESLQILQTLSASDPSNLTWQRDINISLNRIGQAQQASGNLAEAVSSFERGLAISRRLAANEPNRPGLQRDVAVTLNLLGDLGAASGDMGRAYSRYDEALAMIRPVADGDAGNADWQRDLSLGLGKTGDTLVALGKAERANALFEEAVSISRKLASGKTERDVRAQTDLIINLFRLAGVSARTRGQNLDEAIAIADRLAQAGTLPANAQNWPKLLRDERAKAR